MKDNTLKNQLSTRLRTVMELLTPVGTVVDVGCDHGYVAISLIQEKKADKIIAMDVNRGPLARAVEHIRQYGMENCIETRLSNGLEAIMPKEADAAIIAGMGGKLVTGILERGMEQVKTMKELILQPQSDLEYVRRWLRNHEFVIDAESIVYEDGKYYPMMRVIPDGRKDCTTKLYCALQADVERNENVAVQTDVDDNENIVLQADGQRNREIAKRVEDRYGPKLLGQADPVLLQFLHKEQKVYEEILHALQGKKEVADAGRRRMEEVSQLLNDIRWTVAYYFSE